MSDKVNEAAARLVEYGVVQQFGVDAIHKITEVITTDEHLSIEDHAMLVNIRHRYIKDIMTTLTKQEAKPGE